MAGYFNVGETKVRPGAYFNVQNDGGGESIGAVNGITAVLFRSPFGPLNKAVILDASEPYASIFGDGLTTDAIDFAVAGGARTIIAVRVGTGGAAGSVSLTVGTGENTGNVSLKALHPGALALSATVRTKLSDSTMKELIIYNGTAVFETFDFAVSSADEVAGLKEAVAKSSNFTVDGTATGAVAAVSQKAFTGGENPTTATADYSNALSTAEKFYFNTVCVDTTEPAVHALVAAFLDRIYDAGQFGCAVVAEDHTVDLDTRQTHAAAFNAHNTIYVLNAYGETSDGTMDGYQTAAYIAGLYAAVEANISLTHTVLSRMSALLEPLTNSQMVAAEKKGCLVLSTNAADQVWIDKAINTLVTPPSNLDAGWKKMRRVKTRYELLYRCNTAADNLVGQVDNDVNGQATIQSALQEIGNAMIAEGKLNAFTVELASYPVSDADYCYFNLGVIDKDSAELIYLTYRFRFSTNVAA